METKLLKLFRKRFKMVYTNTYHLLDTLNVEEVTIVRQDQFEYPITDNERYRILVRLGILELLQTIYGKNGGFDKLFYHDRKRQQVEINVRIKKRKEQVAHLFSTSLGL